MILYHCQYVPFDSLLIQGVYAICVPLFFMVNGYLMLRKERSISEMLQKSGKVIAVMFFWAFVSTGVYMLTGGEFSADDIIGGGKALIHNSLLISKPYCNHLWFLQAVVVLNLLNPMIYAFVHGNDRRLKYLLVILAVCTIRFFDIALCRFTNPMLGWMIGFSLLYYVLGYALLDKHLRMEKVKTWVVILSGITLVLSQWGYNYILTKGALSTLNAEKMWVNDVVWDGYNALFIVGLTMMVVLLFQRIEWRTCRWVQFIGQYSLAIYVMQTPVQRIWER